MEYSPQGISQNKKRLQEFLVQKGVSLDTVKVSYMPKASEYYGKIDYDNPKTVSFAYLPSDIQRCEVLVDGKMRWKVEIGSTELTAHPLTEQ